MTISIGQEFTCLMIALQGWLCENSSSGARFTWTNKQTRPVRSVLDRVFMSPKWESKFLMVSLMAETWIGSDHTPLILDSGKACCKKKGSLKEKPKQEFFPDPIPGCSG
jgi:hypothetical protein